MFSCQICKIFKNPLLTENLQCLFFKLEQIDLIYGTPKTKEKQDKDD